MKKGILLILIMILTLSVVSCGKTNTDVTTSYHTQGSTAPQSTIHEYTGLAIPKSWSTSDKISYEGSEWPHNKLCDLLPKPDFGKNMNNVIALKADLVSFAVNLENVTIDNAKAYMKTLEKSGFKDLAVDQNDSDYFAYSGKSNNGMNLFVNLNNKTEKIQIILDKSY